jgi:hypothetical protein
MWAAMWAAMSLRVLNALAHKLLSPHCTCNIERTRWFFVA